MGAAFSTCCGGSNTSDLGEDLRTAGLKEVNMTPDGLDPKYLLRILNFITLTSQKRRSVEIKLAQKRRLELYKEGKETEYRELIKEEMKQSDLTSEVVLQEIMAELDISLTEF